MTEATRYDRLRAAAADLIQQEGGPVEVHGPGISMEGAVTRLLMVAWADAVRAEWQAHVDTVPDMAAKAAVAKELMIADGYDMNEPIVMAPGMKPAIAPVDGKEAICVDYCMAQVSPLSALYMVKVVEALGIAEKVAEKAESAKAVESSHD
jgi:hypothetical protein